MVQRCPTWNGSGTRTAPGFSLNTLSNFADINLLAIFIMLPLEGSAALHQVQYAAGHDRMVSQAEVECGSHIAQVRLLIFEFLGYVGCLDNTA